MSRSLDCCDDAATQGPGGLLVLVLVSFWLAFSSQPSPGLSQAEVLSRYDHRVWWVDAEAARTQSSFDLEKFNPGIEDESLAFETRFGGIARPGLASGLGGPVAVGEAGGPAAYQDFLENEGLLFDSLPLVGTSYVLQGNGGYHAKEGGFGDFAWDFVKVDEAGRSYEGTGTQNEDYFVWREPVFLPLGGFVAEVVRSAPDNPPGLILGPQANLLGIRITGRYYLYLLHFRSDTIPLEFEVGDFLAAGTYVGETGNSGVTLEPHLHMTLQWLDREGARLWSVPGAFRNLWRSNDGETFLLEGRSLAPTGSWVSTEPPTN